MLYWSLKMEVIKGIKVQNLNKQNDVKILGP